MKKFEKSNKYLAQRQIVMPYFIILDVADNVSCAYWQTGERFFRKFENEQKAKRISAEEYFSVYDEYRNY